MLRVNELAAFQAAVAAFSWDKLPDMKMPRHVYAPVATEEWLPKSE